MAAAPKTSLQSCTSNCAASLKDQTTLLSNVQNCAQCDRGQPSWRQHSICASGHSWSALEAWTMAQPSTCSRLRYVQNFRGCIAAKGAAAKTLQSAMVLTGDGDGNRSGDGDNSVFFTGTRRGRGQHFQSRRGGGQACMPSKTVTTGLKGTVHICRVNSFRGPSTSSQEMLVNQELMLPTQIKLAAFHGIIITRLKTAHFL